MSDLKVEVGQYRLINKGALRAFFSLVIHPSGQKIIDCRHFVHADNEWFSLPQKEIKHEDGRKSDYISYISYLNKPYLEQLKLAVMAALKDIKPQESYEKTKNESNSIEKGQLPPKASTDWDSYLF